ncbi:MAG: transposase [Clostridia bacterium]|jgi:transposase-like protein
MARQFTEQFKKDALSYVHDHSDLSINACARNLGISTNTLHGWLKKQKSVAKSTEVLETMNPMRLKRMPVLGKNSEIRKMLLKS